MAELEFEALKERVAGKSRVTLSSFSDDLCVACKVCLPFPLFVLARTFFLSTVLLVFWWFCMLFVCFLLSEVVCPELNLSTKDAYKILGLIQCLSV